MESEVRSVTTASPVNLPNHHPVLKGLLLNEHILTRNFQGDQHFFRKDGSIAMYPTIPGSVSAPDSGHDPTQVVPHEDAPAFSDIASTATEAATSSLTTFSATTSPPLVSFPQTKTTKEKIKGLDKVELTTHRLTTQVMLHSQASGGKSSPVAFSSAEGMHFPVDATISPILTRVEKGEVSKPGLKNKTNPDRPLPKPISSSQEEDSTPTASTSVITTTTITTLQTSEPCSMNFTDPEGNIEILQQLDSGVECNYLITVYLGYGIEVQVLNVSVLEGEQVTVEDTGGQEPFILANESFLMRGLILRSWSNQISIRLRSDQRLNSGFLLLHYQAFVLSCAFPKEPSGGDVSVTHLHAGGEAFFTCLTGYRLQGPKTLTCRNATKPYWSGKEPLCVASCGGMIKNATYGRIVSPGFPGNYSNNLTCHWVLEAPEGHRLHIHFEKVALAEDDDRLLIKNGNNIDSPPIYDSFEVEYLPNEGVLSTGRYLFIEFTTDGSMTSTGAAIRYEAFAKGMCYEPFVKYGNFSGSDSSYGLGAVVEFSCNPGYTLEQGSVVIECVDTENPQWNETEPACRAVCSGEITDSAGVVLSPNWPEAYDKGQDCIWGVHVEEDKRIMLDIQVKNICRATEFYHHNNSFVISKSIFFSYLLFRTNATFMSPTEVPRNDTCPELPEIPNGWKSTSHPDLIHGTVVTYQCYPGFTLTGSEILMCQWDLTWSGDVPRCEEVLTCKDPGNVEHSRKVIMGSRFAVGSTLQFICNKGYVLSGSSLLTCYNRDSAVPKWSDKLPKCVRKYDRCVCFLRLQGKSLRMQTSSPPYDNMTEESAFDNPIYESGVSTDVMSMQDVDSQNTSVLS
uniref:Seizure related 6 homolog a n=1 Tax=Oryzias sinensis TaxID=183150 RepID=A0A8C7YLN8_9TELE